jgi:hypothetical protein
MEEKLGAEARHDREPKPIIEDEEREYRECE